MIVLIYSAQNSEKISILGFRFLKNILIFYYVKQSTRTNLMKKLLILITIILIGCDLGIDATIEVQNDSELVKEEVSSSSFEEISSSSDDMLSSSSETIILPETCNIEYSTLYNNGLYTPSEVMNAICQTYSGQNMVKEFEDCDCLSFMFYDGI